MSGHGRMQQYNGRNIEYWRQQCAKYTGIDFINQCKDRPFRTRKTIQKTMYVGQFSTLEEAINARLHPKQCLTRQSRTKKATTNENEVRLNFPPCMHGVKFCVAMEGLRPRPHVCVYYRDGIPVKLNDQTADTIVHILRINTKTDYLIIKESSYTVEQRIAFENLQKLRECKCYKCASRCIMHVLRN